jgi:hypothetical protein
VTEKCVASWIQDTTTTATTTTATTVTTMVQDIIIMAIIIIIITVIIIMAIMAIIIMAIMAIIIMAIIIIIIIIIIIMAIIIIIMATIIIITVIIMPGQRRTTAPTASPAPENLASIHPLQPSSTAEHQAPPLLPNSRRLYHHCTEVHPFEPRAWYPGAVAALGGISLQGAQASRPSTVQAANLPSNAVTAQRGTNRRHFRTSHSGGKVACPLHNCV